MTKRKALWTEAEIAILRRCAGRGMTSLEVHQQLPHRSPESIRTKAASEGLHFQSRHFSAPRTADPEASGAKTTVSRNTTNLTAFILGDPPVGRSALDMKVSNGKV